MGGEALAGWEGVILSDTVPLDETFCLLRRGNVRENESERQRRKEGRPAGRETERTTISNPVSFGTGILI